MSSSSARIRGGAVEAMTVYSVASVRNTAPWMSADCSRFRLDRVRKAVSLSGIRYFFWRLGLSLVAITCRSIPAPASTDLVALRATLLRRAYC
jgi:hypothetical protein